MLKAIATAGLIVIAATTEIRAEDCPVGAYTNGSDTLVSYKRRTGGGTHAPYFLRVSGERGFHGPETGVSCKAEGIITAPDGDYSRVKFRETDTVFNSEGLRLKGRLIEPVSGSTATRPLVVFVHGSESTPTVGEAYYPYMLASQGISVFAYDKRGTGGSEGHYSQDFYKLAKDAGAAAEEAKRLASGRYGRFGFFGGSQGGWVAPIAATPAKADFLVVGFGLLVMPLEENAEQVATEMREMGYGEADISKAKEVTDAVGTLMASGFQEGFALLDSVKRKYGREPWFSKIEGEFTALVLHADAAAMRSVAAENEQIGVPWRHDAVGVLRELVIPQLWVIAGADREAPGNLTTERLAMLQNEGLEITTALFPDTDHGMVEFVETADGTRTYTRVTEGYFRLISDYMKGEMSARYGRAILKAPGRRE